ncbi:MAG: hypothetical protein ABJB01_04295 [Rudaea sp.]
MIRAVGWLCVVILAIGAHVYDSNILRGLCAMFALGLLAITTPSSLRPALIGIALIAAAILIVFDANTLFDALPALIAAFVGYLFARTLLPNRTPLIARAIVSVDGPEWLNDPAVAAYAKRLTLTWALYQTLLAAIAVAAIFHQRGFLVDATWLPTPRVFGAILPIAVALLFVVEFLLRPVLLPQAPRRTLFSFAQRLIVAWPSLLDDGRVETDSDRR